MRIRYRTEGKGLLDRVVIDPKIMVGKPVIKGTRIPVELILKKLAQNMDINEILGIILDWLKRILELLFYMQSL